MHRFKSIQWKAWLKTADPSKAHKLFSRMIEALGCEAREVKIAGDRTDSDFHVVEFKVDLDARSIQDAIFKSLQMASGLAYHWEVGVPQEYSGDRWEFSGSFKGQTRVPGVEAVLFETQNFDHTSA